MFLALNAFHLSYFHLRVYNRWGQKIMDSFNASEGWNGMVKGKPADTGTYTWLCDYTLPGNTAIEKKKGLVTLMR